MYPYHMNEMATIWIIKSGRLILVIQVNYYEQLLSSKYYKMYVILAMSVTFHGVQFPREILYH